MKKVFSIFLVLFLIVQNVLGGMWDTKVYAGKISNSTLRLTATRAIIDKNNETVSEVYVKVDEPVKILYSLGVTGQRAGTAAEQFKNITINEILPSGAVVQSSGSEFDFNEKISNLVFNKGSKSEENFTSKDLNVSLTFSQPGTYILSNSDTNSSISYTHHGTGQGTPRTFTELETLIIHVEESANPEEGPQYGSASRTAIGSIPIYVNDQGTIRYSFSGSNIPLTPVGIDNIATQIQLDQSYPAQITLSELLPSGVEPVDKTEATYNAGTGRWKITRSIDTNLVKIDDTHYKLNPNTVLDLNVKYTQRGSISYSTNSQEVSFNLIAYISDSQGNNKTIQGSIQPIQPLTVNIVQAPQISIGVYDNGIEKDRFQEDNVFDKSNRHDKILSSPIDLSESAIARFTIENDAAAKYQFIQAATMPTAMPTASWNIIQGTGTQDVQFPIGPGNYFLAYQITNQDGEKREGFYGPFQIANFLRFSDIISNVSITNSTGNHQPIKTVQNGQVVIKMKFTVNRNVNPENGKLLSINIGGISGLKIARIKSAEKIAAGDIRQKVQGITKTDTAVTFTNAFTQGDYEVDLILSVGNAVSVGSTYSITLNSMLLTPNGILIMDPSKDHTLNNQIPWKIEQVGQTPVKQQNITIVPKPKLL